MKRSEKTLNRHSRIFQYLGNMRKTRDSAKVVVDLRLGALWAGTCLGILGFIFGFDWIAEAIWQCLTLIIELVQERLETMYRKGFNLDLYHAQMATAYTGFVLITIAGAVLVRRSMAVLREFRDVCQVFRKKAGELRARHWENFCNWWRRMDSFDQCFAALGIAVLALPIIALVCMALGKALADLV